MALFRQAVTRRASGGVKDRTFSSRNAGFFPCFFFWGGGGGGIDIAMQVQAYLSAM